MLYTKSGVDTTRVSVFCCKHGCRVIYLGWPPPLLGGAACCLLCLGSCFARVRECHKSDTRVIHRSSTQCTGNRHFQWLPVVVCHWE